MTTTPGTSRRHRTTRQGCEDPAEIGSMHPHFDATPSEEVKGELGSPKLKERIR
jgi:hypothetical protein